MSISAMKSFAAAPQNNFYTFEISIPLQKLVRVSYASKISLKVLHIFKSTTRIRD